MDNKTKRKSVLFHLDKLETINMLSDAKAGALFKLLLRYAGGEQVEAPKDEVVRVVFSLLRQQIDHDSERYDDVIQKRSAAGKKSAALRKTASTKVSPVRGAVDEGVSETVDETVTETVDESVTETVDETVTETVDETVTETVDETATETVDETVTETVDENVTEPVDETVTETKDEAVTETKDEAPVRGAKRAKRRTPRPSGRTLPVDATAQDVIELAGHFGFRWDAEEALEFLAYNRERGRTDGWDYAVKQWEKHRGDYRKERKASRPNGRRRSESAPPKQAPPPPLPNGRKRIMRGDELRDSYLRCVNRFVEDDDDGADEQQGRDT